MQCVLKLTGEARRQHPSNVKLQLTTPIVSSLANDSVNGGESSFASTGDSSNEGFAEIREISIFAAGHPPSSSEASGGTQRADQEVGAEYMKN